MADPRARRRAAGSEGQRRAWFDKSLEWIKQNDPRDPDLRQIWAEAAELLGQPGPSETGPSLAERLPAVLKGMDQPRDAAERLAFARMAYDRESFGTAARLWAEAFAADPKLGSDREAQRLYHAARAAILAADGKGKDEPAPDNAAKARLRAQALDWLKTELATFASVIGRAPPGQKTVLIRTVEDWKSTPEMAGIRDAEALKKLPEEEQMPWRTLWAGVDTLIKPDDPWNHTHLGEALNAEGKRQEASAEFRTAVKLAPEDSVTCFNMGMAIGAQGHMDQALELLTRAAKCDRERNGNTGLAIWVRGDVLRDLGRYDEAVASYQSIRAFPQVRPEDLREVEDRIKVTEVYKRSHAARAARRLAAGWARTARSRTTRRRPSSAPGTRLVQERAERLCEGPRLDADRERSVVHAHARVLEKHSGSGRRARCGGSPETSGQGTEGLAGLLGRRRNTAQTRRPVEPYPSR